MRLYKGAEWEDRLYKVRDFRGPSLYKGVGFEVGTRGASPVGQRSESRTVRALRCYRAALMIAFSASAFASARFDPVRRYSFAALFACSISACMMFLL